MFAPLISKNKKLKKSSLSDEKKRFKCVFCFQVCVCVSTEWNAIHTFGVWAKLETQGSTNVSMLNGQEQVSLSASLKWKKETQSKAKHHLDVGLKIKQWVVGSRYGRDTLHGFTPWHILWESCVSGGTRSGKEHVILRDGSYTINTL